MYQKIILLLLRILSRLKKYLMHCPHHLNQPCLLNLQALDLMSLCSILLNVNNYVTNKSMALNLGIYTCDLSFASLYEQTQLIVDYMNAAKKMADGLGILKAIDQSQIDKLEENINNSEVIMGVS